jgi:hypothetical protein
MDVMPIQFPDFQRISFNEANPGLVGAERGQNLMQNFMKFPQELQLAILQNKIKGAEAKYAEPMAKEGLTKAQQENEWNPKIWQSEIGLRGAQSGLAGAQTGNTNIEAKLNQIKLDYLKQLLGNKNQVGQQSSSSQMGGGQSGGQQSSDGSMGGSQNQVGGGQSTQQPNNSLYGISTPTPTQEDIANKMFFGVDTFTSKQNQALTQQQAQKNSFIKEIGASVQAANQAVKARIALNGFNTAMNAPDNMKGPYWGTTPTSGWQTLYHADSSISNAQTADNFAANVLPGAMAEIKEAMGSGQFSRIDMQASQKMKVDRTMTDDARKNATNFMNGVFARMDERPKFLQTMSNPQKGADMPSANLLWQSYQDDFPIMGKDGQTPNLDNLNMWPLYTSPKAIASIKATGEYHPTRAEKNTFMMKYPDGKVLPVKRKDIGAAIRKGASSI